MPIFWTGNEVVTMTFRDLRIGQRFRFASERTMPYSGMAHGPWIKISPRRYCHVETPHLTYNVGTTHVEVDLEPEVIH